MNPLSFPMEMARQTPVAANKIVDPAMVTPGGRVFLKSRLAPTPKTEPTSAPVAPPITTMVAVCIEVVNMMSRA